MGRTANSDIPEKGAKQLGLAANRPQNRRTINRPFARHLGPLF